MTRYAHNYYRDSLMYSFNDALFEEEEVDEKQIEEERIKKDVIKKKLRKYYKNEEEDQFDVHEELKQKDDEPKVTISSIFDDQKNLDIAKEALSKHGLTYIDKIGQGGFSIVALAHSEKYFQNFVVKIRKYDKVVSAADEKEINNLLMLNHPNIIKMFEYFVDDSFMYIVLEHCENGSLKDYLEKNGPIENLNLLASVMTQIGSALLLCHEKNIAHRDIKPANVLIDRFGRVKLADFGLSSKIEIINGEKKLSEFGGSKPYMAPEIIAHIPYDPMKADVWALGILFYEIIIGEHPWGANSTVYDMELSIAMGMINYSSMTCPLELIKIIAKMLQTNSDKRCSMEWIMKQPFFKDAGNKRPLSLIIDEKGNQKSIHEIASEFKLSHFNSSSKSKMGKSANGIGKGSIDISNNKTNNNNDNNSDNTNDNSNNNNHNLNGAGGIAMVQANSNIVASVDPGNRRKSQAQVKSFKNPYMSRSSMTITSSRRTSLNMPHATFI